MVKVLLLVYLCMRTLSLLHPQPNLAPHPPPRTTPSSQASASP